LSGSNLANSRSFAIGHAYRSMVDLKPSDILGYRRTEVYGPIGPLRKPQSIANIRKS